jgi:hypothetical protein
MPIQLNEENNGKMLAASLSKRIIVMNHMNGNGYVFIRYSTF